MSQNLIGSELLISWSVCVCLACDLLQVVDPSIRLDMEWVKVGSCVNSSGNLCQVVFRVEHASWQCPSGVPESGRVKSCQ